MDALRKNLARVLSEKPDEWIQVDELLSVNPVVESTEFAYKVCADVPGLSLFIVRQKTSVVQIDDDGVKKAAKYVGVSSQSLSLSSLPCGVPTDSSENVIGIVHTPRLAHATTPHLPAGTVQSHRPVDEAGPRLVVPYLLP